MSSENQSPVFFVCSRCNNAAFEIPSFDGVNPVHVKCSEIFLEKKAIQRQINDEYDPTKPIARLHIDGDVIVIDHPFSIKLNEAYHKYYGFKWNKEKRRREIKKDKVNSMSSQFLLREIQFKAPDFNWKREDDVMSFLEPLAPADAEKDTRTKKLNEIKKAYDPNIDLSHMKIEPFGFQKAGIAFLESVNGVALIGDSMGLGKSMMAIGYTSKHNLKTVIVCPASLKFNWKNEVQKFTKCTATVIEDCPDPKELKLFDYVIVNYEQLEKWEKVLKKIKFQCVVLDESHYIANVSSNRTKNVFRLFKDIPHRIELSGTPSKNRPIELYPQLKFLRPEEFPNKQDFGMRYCNPTQGYNGFWEFKGASHLDELNERISPFFIRRLKNEVLTDLPEKRISDLFLEMSDAERKTYNKAIGSNDKVGTIKDFLKLPPTNKENHLIEFMKMCSVMKAPYVVDFVKQLIQEDTTGIKKVIVFAHFRETQQILKKHFDSIAVSLLGDDKPEARQAAVDKFQTDPNVRIFIGSTKAAGVGITLTAADTVIFADLLWTPSDHKQAEDRAYRIGQVNNVLVYYIMFSKTIEEVVWRTLMNKLVVVSQTVGDIPFDKDAAIEEIARQMYEEQKAPSKKKKKKSDEEKPRTED